MMDQAALLREYHRCLDGSRSLTALNLNDRAFCRLRRDLIEERFIAARHVLYKAHAERIKGNSSPAACDEALAQALKEVSP